MLEYIKLNQLECNSPEPIRMIDELLDVSYSQAAEERRKARESEQLASLAEKQKKAAEVRAKKATLPPMIGE